MQFRVISSGNTVSLYPLPLDPRVPPLVLGGSQGLIAPLFPEFSGQLFAVTDYEEVSSRLGSGDGGPEKRHVVEYERPPQLKLLLFGRLASDWTGVPIVDQVFVWLDGQQSEPFTWIPLDQLFHKVVEKLGALSSTTLSIGTPCALEVLEATVRNGGLDDSHVGVIEAVLRLGVQQTKLSQYVPRILALIPEIVATSARHREQLDETMRKMAAELDAAKQKYDEDFAALMCQRTRSEALQFHYEQWQKAQLAAEADAH
ncbi:MAG: OmpH family outer membrane protein [Candidatus Moraniibacteriota bacterium]|nr:MAG: OmpH family outer membrane protein [Candidatus Moranbacteria bacterium]